MKQKFITEETLKDDDMLTFVPVIIAPKKRLNNLYENFTKILSDNGAEGVLKNKKIKKNFLLIFMLIKKMYIVILLKLFLIEWHIGLSHMINTKMENIELV